MALVSLAVAGGTAGADDEFRLPGLVAPGTDSLTFPQDTDADPMRLCNTRDLDLTRVSTEVSGSSEDARKIDVDVPAGIAAGTCVDVVFTPDPLSVAEAGATGTVVFVSDGAGSLTIPFTITDPHAGATVEKVLGETTFHATADGDAPDLDEADISLLYTSDKEPSFLDDKEWTLADGDQTMVVAANFTRQSNNVRIYRLAGVPGDRGVEPGTYEGVIAFGGDQGDVPVTVEVDDAFWYFLVVLLAGFGVGLWLKILTDRRRFTARLENERAAIADIYGGPLAPPWGPRFLPPSPALIKKFQNENRAAQDAYTSTVVSVDVAAPAFAAVVKGLQDARADAVAFREKLPASLQALQEKLAATIDRVETFFPGFREPALLGADADGAAAVLRLQPKMGSDLSLGVGQATKIAARADELLPLITAWTTAVEDLGRHAQWAMALQSHDAGKVDEARGHLGEVAHDLWSATSIDTIRAALSSEQMRKAYDLLAEVSGPARVRLPSEPEANDSWSGMDPTQQKHRELHGPEGSDAGPTNADQGYRSHRFYDFAPLFVTALLALMAAVTSAKTVVYDAQDFASLGTVAATFVIGLGATAVIDAVITAVTWTRGGLSSLVKAS